MPLKTPFNLKPPDPTWLNTNTFSRLGFSLSLPSLAATTSIVGNFTTATPTDGGGSNPWGSFGPHVASVTLGANQQSNGLLWTQPGTLIPASATITQLQVVVAFTSPPAGAGVEIRLIGGANIPSIVLADSGNVPLSASTTANLTFSSLSNAAFDATQTYMMAVLNGPNAGTFSANLQIQIWDYIDYTDLGKDVLPLLNAAWATYQNVPIIDREWEQAMSQYQSAMFDFYRGLATYRNTYEPPQWN